MTKAAVQDKSAGDAEAGTDVTTAQAGGEVVTTPTGGAPAFMVERAAADAGKGVSTAADDNLVPLIYILQAQSPQCNKRGPDYVEGAESGAIWLRNSGLPAINGEKGILFQPCYFQKDWVEWIPRSAGGGFAGRHDERPEEAVEKALDPADPDKMSWVLPNGNTVAETRYHIGIVHLDDGRRMPYVIPLSGSGHTVSRGWMFLMNSKSMPGVERAPSWSCLYRLTTKERSNKKGTWMTFEVKDAGWVQTAQDYERGAELYKSFEAGEKQVDKSDLETAAAEPAAGNDAAM